MDRRLAISRYLQDYLYNNSKYTESDRLNRFEWSIYSQGGDDGIISEIFKRVGVKNRFFVEFGVGDGLQNNTITLLLSGWKGLWFEGDSGNFKKVLQNTEIFANKGNLNVTKSMINVDNVEELFLAHKVPKEPDFLSIDIDGNDYWIWKAIVSFKPRVIVLEYNAAYGPNLSLVQRYNQDYFWKRTHFYGASLSALYVLAEEKGYSLVACNFLGNNAYFVRNDIVNGRFSKESTPEHLFEEHKVFLLQNQKYPVSLIDNETVS